MGYDWHADSFSEYGYHVPSRTIYLQPDSDEFQFEYLIKGLVVLTELSLKPIVIVMDAPGGDEYHGLACYDAIRTCKAPVTVEAYGHCMSMGSWIMQAADLRMLSPNCTMMLHYGTWGYEDSIPNQRSLFHEMERLNRLMEDAYLETIREKHPHFTRKKLQKMLTSDSYLTAQQAVDLGLADGIIT